MGHNQQQQVQKPPHFNFKNQARFRANTEQEI